MAVVPELARNVVADVMGGRMPKASELLARASHFRDLAHRARQSSDELAATFADKARLEGIIADLEAQALALEKEAATLPTPSTDVSGGIGPTSTTRQLPVPAELKSSPRSKH